MFQKNVQSTKFVVYMCDNVLPVLSDVVPPGSGETKAEGTEDDKTSTDKTSSDKTSSDYDIKLELLRQLAEMSTHTANAGGEETLGRVFKKLLVRFMISVAMFTPNQCVPRSSTSSPGI